jgi:hypothetical protein
MNMLFAPILLDNTTCGSPPAAGSLLAAGPNPIFPLWIGFLILAAAAFQWQTRWLTKFNIFTVFLVGLFVRYGIAVPLSDGINPSSSAHIPISSTQLLEYYVAVVLTYVCVFAGAFAAYRWMRKVRLPITLPEWADSRVLIAASVAVLGLVLIVWVALPWKDFLAGLLKEGHLSQAAARLQRVAYGDVTLYSSSALNYAGSFARFALMPVLLWTLYFHRARSRIIHGLFWFAFAMLALIGIASGQKYPELLLIVGFVIARLLIAGAPSVFNWKTIMAGVILIFGAVPLLFHFQQPTWSYMDLVNGTIFRLTVEYSRVAQLRFIFYPALHPYLLGSSSFVLRGFAHVLHINTGDAVSPEIYIPAHSPCVGPNYGGTWNAGFFSDAWADFSWPGVIIASLVAGAILATIHRWYESGPKGPMQMGTYTAVCISALYLTDVALLTASWTYGLLSSFLVYWTLGALTTRLRRPQPQPRALETASPG